MAITIGLGRVFPGVGVSSFQSQQLIAGIPVISGTKYFVPSVTPFTSAGLLVPTVTCGKIRVKIYNPSSSANTLTKVQIVATDGTNTVVFWDFNFGTAVTLSSTSWFDAASPAFVLDTAPSTTNGGAVGYLIGSANAVTGNGGAIAFGVTPTLSSTNVTGITMDLELLGLI
jgi:hypothetical protein